MDNKQPIISIIVPVYNVEEYLPSCLKSIQNQTFTDFECILINDGSTDNSGTICDEFHQLNTRFQVIHQENQGVSKARNAGLSLAKGKYISFVDADDYLVDGGLAYILNHYTSKHECDIIRYFCTIVYQKTEVSNDVNGEITFQGTGHEFIEKFGLDTFSIGYLYKNEYLKNHHLKFFLYIIGEDFLFISTVLLENPRMLSTTSNIYRYMIHTQSASTTRNEKHARKCVKHHISVNKDIIKNLKEKQINKKHPIYLPSINSLQGKMILIFSRILSSNFSCKEYKRIIEDCKIHGFLPIRLQTNSTKLKISYCLINQTMSYFILYRINCYLYSNLFVPYILPKLNRDK